MAVETEKFAPYASIGSVLTVIDQLRSKGMPEAVNSAWLSRLGLSEAVHVRVLQTLRFLGLTDKDDRRTAEADRLRLASPDDYPDELKELLNKAYHRVFAIIDAEDAQDEKKLEHAFWGCEPAAVRDRMRSLFLGLLKEAQMIPGGPVSRGLKARRVSDKPRDGGSAVNGAQPPKPHVTRAPTDNPPPAKATAPQGEAPEYYELLHAALRQLPPERKWTEKRRDRWIAAITAGVDLLVEVVEPEAVSAGHSKPETTSDEVR